MFPVIENSNRPNKITEANNIKAIQRNSKRETEIVQFMNFHEKSFW